MAAFLILFLVWLFATGKYPEWIALARDTGNRPTETPAKTTSDSSSNGDALKTIGKAAAAYFGSGE